MGWFDSRSKIEKELEQRYGPELQATMDMSSSDVRDTIAHVHSKAVNAEPPPDYAETLLHGDDPQVKETLRELREEGATDDDIRWWWNMSETERQLRGLCRDSARLAMFMKSRDDGMEPKEAMKEVNRWHALYIIPDPPDGPPPPSPTGEDRPLPQELENRVLDYVLLRSKTDPESFKQELEPSSSFNAFVRAKIRQKEL